MKRFTLFFCAVGIIGSAGAAVVQTVTFDRTTTPLSLYEDSKNALAEIEATAARADPTNTVPNRIEHLIQTDADYTLALRRAKTLSVMTPQNAMEQIAEITYGKVALETIVNSPDWMLDLSASGPILRGPEYLLVRLSLLWRADEIYRKDHPETRRGKLATDPLLRSVATALSLNAPSDTILYRTWQTYRSFLDRGLMHGQFFVTNTREHRFSANPQGFDHQSLEYGVKNSNSNIGNIGNGGWQVSYRTDNFFGSSIHGSEYQRPWNAMLTGYPLGREVGAVCGGISYYGAMAGVSSGRMTITGGQPSHCAATHRRFDGSLWDIDSNVSPPTGAHFGFWGMKYYQCLEYYDDLFSNPNCALAYQLIWAAQLMDARQGGNVFSEDVDALYRRALERAPNHYQALLDYAQWLNRVAPNDMPRWFLWADLVARGMRQAPFPGWDLLHEHFVERVQTQLGQDTLLAALRRLHRQMPEGTRPTRERFNFKGTVLDRQKQLLGNERMLTLAETILDTNYSSASYFDNTLDWGNSTFGDNFLHVLADVYVAHGNTAGLKGTVLNSIRTSSQMGDVQQFNQMCNLYEKQFAVPPEDAPRIVSTETPPFASPMLSGEGVLTLSSYASDTQKFRHLRRVIDDSAYGLYFAETDKDTRPSSMTVQLPGDAEIDGIAIQNAETALTVEVAISADKTNWTVVDTVQLGAEATLTLAPANKISRYVRLLLPNVNEDSISLKLRKIQVFGMKRY
ncbi:MAG: hypothetical protein RSB74_03465 [Kiritimatiellia bacterium]